MASGKRVCVVRVNVVEVKVSEWGFAIEGN